MSRKSRQPDAAASGKKGGRKGKKGKKGAESSSSVAYTEVVEETGVPFGIVVLIALVMSLPSLIGFFDGSLEFRPVLVRLIAALLVSWLLCELVYSVVKSSAAAAATSAAAAEAERRREASYEAGAYGERPYGDDVPRP